MCIFNSDDKLHCATTLFKSLANEKRLRILCILSGGEKSVSAIEARVDLSQSALSQHLSRLRRDKIVKTRRDAQTVYYSLMDNRVVSLLTQVCSEFNIM